MRCEFLHDGKCWALQRQSMKGWESLVIKHLPKFAAVEIVAGKEEPLTLGARCVAASDTVTQAQCDDFKHHIPGDTRTSDMRAY